LASPNMEVINGIRCLLVHLEAQPCEAMAQVMAPQLTVALASAVEAIPVSPDVLWCFAKALTSGSWTEANDDEVALTTALRGNPLVREHVQKVICQGTGDLVGQAAVLLGRVWGLKPLLVLGRAAPSPEQVLWAAQRCVEQAEDEDLKDLVDLAAMCIESPSTSIIDKHVALSSMYSALKTLKSRQLPQPAPAVLRIATAMLLDPTITMDASQATAVQHIAVKCIWVACECMGSAHAVQAIGGELLQLLLAKLTRIATCDYDHKLREDAAWLAAQLGGMRTLLEWMRQVVQGLQAPNLDENTHHERMTSLQEILWRFCIHDWAQSTDLTQQDITETIDAITHVVHVVRKEEVIRHGFDALGHLCCLSLATRESRVNAATIVGGTLARAPTSVLTDVCKAFQLLVDSPGIWESLPQQHKEEIGVFLDGVLVQDNDGKRDRLACSLCIKRSQLGNLGLVRHVLTLEHHAVRAVDFAEVGLEQATWSLQRASEEDVPDVPTDLAHHFATFVATIFQHHHENWGVCVRLCKALSWILSNMHLFPQHELEQLLLFAGQALRTICASFFTGLQPRSNDRVHVSLLTACTDWARLCAQRKQASARGVTDEVLAQLMPGFEKVDDGDGEILTLLWEAVAWLKEVQGLSLGIQTLFEASSSQPGPVLTALVEMARSGWFHHAELRPARQFLVERLGPMRMVGNGEADEKRTVLLGLLCAM